VKTTSEIGARSLTGSYGSFSYRLGLMVMAELGHYQRVTVGRGLCGTIDATLPPAPVAFSTKTGLPQASANLSASSRAAMSGDRPAENRREFERLCQGRRTGQTRHAIRATPSARQRSA